MHAQMSSFLSPSPFGTTGWFFGQNVLLEHDMGRPIMEVNGWYHGYQFEWVSVFVLRLHFLLRHLVVISSELRF